MNRKLAIVIASVLACAFARAELVTAETASQAASGFLAKSSVAKRILEGRAVSEAEAAEF